jgi:ammonia channel protein AmtB
MIMAGLLADPSFVGEGQEGLFYGGGKQLGYQIMALLAYATWALGTCAIMFGSLNYFGLFRVDKDVEIMGLDNHHHGGYAYRIKHCGDDDDIAGNDTEVTTKHIHVSDEGSSEDPV